MNTKQHQPLVSKRPEFAPRLGAPLQTAYFQSVEAYRRLTEECEHNPESNAYKVFNAVFYSAIVRKELANEKLRNALATIDSNKQLYRHEVKQKVRLIRQELLRWDVDIARCINRPGDERGEIKLDYYDSLSQYANESLERFCLAFYYSILQLLTRYECPFRREAAELEVACALQEFMHKQLLQEVEANYKQAPPLVRLGVMFDDRMMALTESLRAIISQRAVKGSTLPPGNDIDLNADAHVEQAANNLFAALSSANTINNIVDAAFAPRMEEKK